MLEMKIQCHVELIIQKTGNNHLASMALAPIGFTKDEPRPHGICVKCLVRNSMKFTELGDEATWKQ